MQLNDVPIVVLVASGKGGVGKTTVTSDIARTAEDKGLKVGLIDTDISTPNSPEVVGGEAQSTSDQRLATGDALVAPEVNGIQLVSQGTVLPDEIPVLRGAQWRAETVLDYVENVEWDDDTDMVVIDSPPGTGEELQAVASSVPITQGYVVTTPHPSSVRDARKTHEFFKQAEIGHELVLNMAYIPHSDIIQHVLDTTDLTEIRGVGESKVEAIEDLLGDEVADFNLFGYEPGEGVDIDTKQVATVPYSTHFSLRSSALEPLIDDLAEAEEVTA